jgi:predicted transcriptional regulator
MANVLTIRLDAELARALEAEAERTGASRGEVVRAAIRDRLASTRASALDALRDLDGIVEGPADLSTNKRRLASLGKRAAAERRKA